jgi:hypothetical protein
LGRHSYSGRTLRSHRAHWVARSSRALSRRQPPRANC